MGRCLAHPLRSTGWWRASRWPLVEASLCGLRPAQVDTPRLLWPLQEPLHPAFACPKLCTVLQMITDGTATCGRAEVPRMARSLPWVPLAQRRAILLQLCHSIGLPPRTLTLTSLSPRDSVVTLTKGTLRVPLECCTRVRHPLSEVGPVLREVFRW